MVKQGLRSPYITEMST